MNELSESDFKILDAMKNVVDGIAAMYGEHTEVLLHSLDVRDASIIKIANGYITGRTVGAPITNLALLKLNEGHDVSKSYLTKSPDGKTLRSITTVIRNSENEAIGLLCINANIDAPFQAVMRSLMPEMLTPTDNHDSPEIFARNNDEMMQSSIESIREKVLNDKSISASKKSREIMTRLHDLGVFNLKDSIPTVATQLEISIHTIYRYLREIKSA